MFHNVKKCEAPHGRHFCCESLTQKIRTATKYFKSIFHIGKRLNISMWFDIINGQRRTDEHKKRRKNSVSGLPQYNSSRILLHSGPTLPWPRKSFQHLRWRQSWITRRQWLTLKSIRAPSNHTGTINHGLSRAVYLKRGKKKRSVKNEGENTYTRHP